MEGTAEVVYCGSDEELIVNADRQSEEKHRRLDGRG
jgi:hypothetical protein